jgi:hypothetical protein
MMNKRFLADANELCRFGVGELTAGFSSGKFTPLEVAQATLARAEQVQERFNAFSLIDTDAALAIAKESTARWRSGAPLSGIDGVPTTIKDIVWVKDRAVRYGSRTTSTIPCTQDAPSVKRAFERPLSAISGHAPDSIIVGALGLTASHPRRGNGPAIILNLAFCSSFNEA